MNAARIVLLPATLALALGCQSVVDVEDVGTTGGVAGSSSGGESTAAPSDSSSGSVDSTSSSGGADEVTTAMASTGEGESSSSSSTGTADACPSPHVDPGDALQIADAPMRGNPDGLVTLVLWPSYRCSFCRTFESTLDTLLDGPLGSEVRIFAKLIPLSEENDPDGRIARSGYAAHQLGDFWTFHEAMFAAEGDLREDAVLDGVIAEAGFDVEAFHDVRDSDAAYERVAADLALISDISVSVPASVINGHYVLGAIGPTQLQLEVEPQLEAMLALVDDGLDRCTALGQRIAGQFPPR